MLRWALVAFAPWRGRDFLANDSFWKVQTTLLFFPAAAVLHHAWFYRPTCMLNPFGRSYLSWITLSAWLRLDPSLWVAVVLCLVAYALGRSCGWLRVLVLPVNLSALPLTIWIWDIPGSKRWVCRLAHDSQIELLPQVPLHTRHIYALCAALYVALYWQARPRGIVG